MDTFLQDIDFPVEDKYLIKYMLQKWLTIKPLAKINKSREDVPIKIRKKGENLSRL